MLKIFRKWFLTGLLAAAPIGITLFIVFAILSVTDDALQHVSPAGYDPKTLFGQRIPGLGLLVTFVGLTLIGALVSNIMGNFFIQAWDKLMAKLPLVSGVYGAVKQVMNSVLSDTGQSFREVVYVEFPQAGQYAMGFVIGPADHVPLLEKLEPMVTVFIPMVPLPTSGFLITLPAGKMIRSDMTVEEGLKMSVTLGLVKTSQP